MPIAIGIPLRLVYLYGVPYDQRESGYEVDESGQDTSTKQYTILKFQNHKHVWILSFCVLIEIVSWLLYLSSLLPQFILDRFYFAFHRQRLIAPVIEADISHDPFSPGIKSRAVHLLGHSE